MTGIIEHPLVTEKAMDDLDFENRLQFVVNPDATKPEIEAAVEEQFDVTVVKVNTQLMMTGKKKAIIRLSADDDAGEVASRIGVF